MQCVPWCERQAGKEQVSDTGRKAPTSTIPSLNSRHLCLGPLGQGSGWKQQRGSGSQDTRVGSYGASVAPYC